MGQQNTERIQHPLGDLPVPFRDDQLYQIIHDLSEEDTGKGFSEVSYSGVFVSQIITWKDNSKTQKRSQIDFVYQVGSPFIESIVKSVYDEDTGTVVVATVTATITYNPNKTVQSADVVVARVP